jgi:hypothetical protein
LSKDALAVAQARVKTLEKELAKAQELIKYMRIALKPFPPKPVPPCKACQGSGDARVREDFVIPPSPAYRHQTDGPD